MTTSADDPLTHDPRLSETLRPSFIQELQNDRAAPLQVLNLSSAIAIAARRSVDVSLVLAEMGALIQNYGDI